MPVWSGLPDKKNPVEGQRGLSHPFVILKIKIYTNISVLQGKIQLFLRGDKTQNFFFTLKPLYTYELTLSGPPPRTFPLDSPDGPPPDCTLPLHPPSGPPHCTLPLDSPSGPPTVPSLWTHLVNPPLYPPFGLTQWTPHCTHPLNSPTGPPTIRSLWTHSAEQRASLPPAISITWRSWFSGGFSSWKYLW